MIGTNYSIISINRHSTTYRIWHSISCNSSAPSCSTVSLYIKYHRNPGNSVFYLRTHYLSDIYVKVITWVVRLYVEIIHEL